MYHDPADDVNTLYVTGEMVDGEGAIQVQGVARLLIEGASSDVDPNFGEDGWAIIDENVGSNYRWGIAIHEGTVYATFMEFWQGPTSLLYRFDQESGDLLAVDDLSHIFYIYNRRGHPNKTGPEYTGESDDTDPYANNLYARGPTQVYVDDSGIVFGSWIVRRVVKTGQDVNDVIWINDPGDGYADNEYIYNTNTTKYGFVSGPSRATIYEGFILGPDGTGVMNVSLANVMGHVQAYMDLMLEGTAYDGLYFIGDLVEGDMPTQFEDGGPLTMVQLPADIQEGMITSAPIAVEEVETARPHRFALGQATPNPFNPSTAITFSLAEDVHTTLVVYNSVGQVVRTLVDEPLTAGTYRVHWDSRNDAGGVVSAGMYVYVMEAGTFTETKSMTLVK
jgi:hypothetical protein